MQTKLFSVFLLLVGSCAFAKTNFNCYSFNQVPIQTFQAGQIGCAKTEKQTLVKNGRAKVICLYQGVCQALSDNEKPAILTPEQVIQYQFNGMALAASDFKPSMFGGSGEATIENGITTRADCPDVNGATKDVMFSAGMPVLNNHIHTKTEVETPDITKDGIK